MVRQFFRRFIRSVATVNLLLAVLVACLQNGFIQNTAVNAVFRHFLASDIRVELNNTQGIFPLKTHIEKVSFYKENKIVANAQNISWTFNPFLLRFERFSTESLSLTPSMEPSYTAADDSFFSSFTKIFITLAKQKRFYEADIQAIKLETDTPYSYTFSAQLISLGKHHQQLNLRGYQNGQQVDQCTVRLQYLHKWMKAWIDLNSSRNGFIATQSSKFFSISPDIVSLTGRLEVKNSYVFPALETQWQAHHETWGEATGTAHLTQEGKIAGDFFLRPKQTETYKAQLLLDVKNKQTYVLDSFRVLDAHDIPQTEITGVFNVGSTFSSTGKITPSPQAQGVFRESVEWSMAGIWHDKKVDFSLFQLQFSSFGSLSSTQLSCSPNELSGKFNLKGPEKLPFHFLCDLSGTLKHIQIKASSLAEAYSFCFDQLNLTLLTEEKRLNLEAQGGKNRFVLAASAADGIRIEGQISDGYACLKHTGDVMFKGALDENFSGQTTITITGTTRLSPIILETKWQNGLGQFSLISDNITFGTGKIDLYQQTLELGSFQKTLSQHLVCLKKPLTLDFKTQQISAFLLQVGNGKITSDLMDFGEKWTGTLTYTDLPLSVLNDLMNHPLQTGKLSGKLTLEGEHSVISTSYRLTNLLYRPVSDLAQKSYPFDVNGTALWKNKTLEAHFGLTEQAGIRLNVQASLCYLQPETTFTAKAVGQLELNTFAFLLPEEDRLKGTLNIALNADGTLEHPVFKGHVGIDKGHYESAASGTILKNIQAKFEGNKQTLKLVNCTLIDGSGKGIATGKGAITWKSLKLAPDVVIQLDLKNFAVIRDDGLSADANGFLTLQTKDDHMVISGDVELDPFVILLEDFIDPQAPELAAPNKTDSEPPKSAKNAGPFLFDLNLRTIETGVRIAGFGVESTWFGQMKVTGHGNAPVLEGAINLIQGKMELFGKPLKVTHGIITYTCDHRNNPALDVIATKELLGETVSIHIEGYSSHPRFRLTSTPSLSDEEMLARLLFGKKIQDISPAQGVQLATLATSINSKRPINVLSQIQNSFGFDLFEFKDEKRFNATSGDEQTRRAVSVGKDFGKLRLSVDQAVSTGSGNEARAELAITENVTANATVGGNRSSAMGIDWIKHY